MSEFDPTKYLTKLHGNDYLEVKWRLLWFRTEHPDGSLYTEIVSHVPDKSVVFKATVTTSDHGVATGYAEQGPGDFRGNSNWFEKCETKALGRALGHLGYGTQFTGEDEDEGAPADSPVDWGTLRTRLDSQPPLGSTRPQEQATSPRKITPQQQREVAALISPLGLTKDDANAWAQSEFDRPVAQLYEAEARALIAAMKQRVRATYPEMVGIEA